MEKDEIKKRFFKYLNMVITSNQDPNGFIVDYAAADEYSQLTHGTAKELVAELVRENKFHIITDWETKIQLLRVVPLILT